MTKTEVLIRSILGAVRMDIRPLAYAVDVAVDLMFVQKIPMEDIFVTRDIYPEVAVRMQKEPQGVPSNAAVARRIERLANECWDTLVARGLVMTYIGEPIGDIRAPRDLIFYLAFYIYFEKPFFAAIQQRPELMF